MAAERLLSSAREGFHFINVYFLIVLVVRIGSM